MYPHDVAKYLFPPSGGLPLCVWVNAAGNIKTSPATASSLLC